ncbi:MAG: hypothetical protein K6G03_00540 [Lachnospiraceae bacterium]|nr:hypothetical protein [Lachnospiraceae bacterium]
MTKIRFKIISFLLAFVLVMGNVSPGVIYAAEKGSVSDESAVGELTGIEITGLVAPVAGEKLDDRAVIRSAEGVEWEIPVVWIDESGKAATVAEAGKKYIPNFAFYVPAGYKIKGALSVKLPSFLSALYGADNLLYVADPSSGITYITWNVADTRGFSLIPYEGGNNGTGNTSGSGEDHASGSGQGDSNNGSQGDSGSGDSSDSDQEDSNHSSQSDSGSGESSTDEPDDNKDVDKYREVKIHCTEKAIANIGLDLLADIVRLIKNEIQPKAVAALIDAFPAFKTAADNGEFDSLAGLYIYDSRYDSFEEDDRNLPGVMAYAAFSIGGEPDELFDGEINNSVNVDVSQIVSLNDQGQYELTELELKLLKNIMQHEMMHSIMNMYVTTGMMSRDWPGDFPDIEGEEKHKWNNFPDWFLEGTATSVMDGYWYYEFNFDELSVSGSSRKEGEPPYKEEKLTSVFELPENSIKGYRTNSGNREFGSYIAGYLSVIYLSTIVGKSAEKDDVLGVPDNELVKSGLSTILERLHNGTPLDTIIKETGRYDGIIDYEDKFCMSGDSSTKFCSDFLNYIDGYYADNSAAGNILLPFDSSDNLDALAGRTETSDGQTVLKIMDTNDMVASMHDRDVGLGTAGSYHTFDKRDWGKYYDESIVAACVSYSAGSKAAEDVVAEAELDNEENKAEETEAELDNEENKAEETETESEAESEDAEIAAEAETVIESGTDAEIEAEAAVVVETGLDDGTDVATEVEVVVDTEAVINTDTEIETETADETEAVAEVEAAIESETATETEAEAAVVAETGSGAETEAEAAAVAETGSGAETEAEATAGTEAVVNTESETVAEAEDESEADSDGEAESEAE